MQKSISEYAAVIGIDWADKKHDVCLKVQGEKKVELGMPPDAHRRVEAASKERAQYEQSIQSSRDVDVR